MEVEVGGDGRKGTVEEFFKNIFSLKDVISVKQTSK